MKILEKIKGVQIDLNQIKADGWLLYDFRKSNELATQFLEIPAEQICTRRLFYWIPAVGEPVKIVHQIESHILDHLPGKKLTYGHWKELESHLESVVKGSSNVAMEYSERCHNPYVSKVDGGTIELVKSFGVKLCSSSAILQKHTSVWSLEQLRSHLKAARILDEAVGSAWKLIGNALKAGDKISEKDVQRFILRIFEKEECVASDLPICAFGKNCANPHHETGDTILKQGDFVLIDLWCKRKEVGAVYADITRVGVAASAPTHYQKEVFDVVKNARDAAMDLLTSRLQQGVPVMGCELDDACREVIAKAGFGAFFTHRTGHSIGERDHGDGANIDNYETNDTRYLLPSTCFSIEPGIYLPGEFGVRLEHDVYINPDNLSFRVTQGIQTEIVTLM